MPISDGWLNFSGTDELMAINCDYVYGLRWSDWGAAAGRTDYDVFIYDTPTSSTPLIKGIDGQQAGAIPIELGGRRYTCGKNPDYVAIQRYHAGSGSTGDILEFAANSGIEYYSNLYSATQPVADSASSGVIAVGAIGDSPRGGGTTIASYSSRGPSNDERMRPDLSAASCLTTFAYGSDCFNGTSAATPVVSGAAALVRSAGLATTPAGVKTWLIENATEDRGAAGPDNTFGHGELELPNPPTSQCPPDDGQEPDDSRGTASPLSSGGPVAGIACDDDYFSLSADVGDHIAAQLEFTHAQGDLDLQLQDSTGAQVAKSDGGDDDEHIDLVVAQSGTYYVRVYPYQGSANANAYELTVTWSDPTANTAPTISNITNKSTTAGTSTGAIPFTVGDAQTAPGSLTLTRTSSNTALVPNGNIVFGGSGANRTVTVTPAAGQTGSTTITVTVSDGALTAQDSFNLTVSSTAQSAPRRRPRA